MTGLTEQQQAFRQLGITGSDAPAICGVSNYRTEADVWLSKKHPSKVKPLSKTVRDRLEWGHHYEELIARKYATETGIPILKPMPRTFSNAEVPWLMGSPDFLSIEMELGVECKKVSEWMKHGWGPAGTDLVPPDVLMQSVHYMLLTGYRRWDVAALIGESDFRVYTLHANRELLNILVERESQFYSRYIAADEEPVFTTSEAIQQFLRQKYPTGNKARIIEVTENDKELMASISDLRAARAAEKIAKGAHLTAKNGVQGHMGNAAEVHWTEQGLKITWKNQKDGTAVAWDEIARAALETSTLSPEGKAALIAKFTTPKPGPRKFVVYDKGGTDDDE